MMINHTRDKDGFLQQEEIRITVMMRIPALMQTSFHPKGETLDRQ